MRFCPHLRHPGVQVDGGRRPRGRRPPRGLLHVEGADPEAVGAGGGGGGRGGGLVVRADARVPPVGPDEDEGGEGHARDHHQEDAALQRTTH